MQIPILNGIYTDTVPDFRTSYPVNMVPVPKATGISAGYLRPAEGAVRLGSILGQPRGAINWNGTLYAIIGDKFISIDDEWNVAIIGSVGNDGLHVTITYGFDRIAFVSADDLYYYDGSALTQVTDADLGRAISVAWVSGYYVTTDGDYLVVTDIANPMSVSPLKYGSSEYDPDPLVGVVRQRTELVAINRYSIETFQLTASTGFPFQRITSATIPKGSIGPTAFCLFDDSIAFIGSGRNEPPSVFLGATGAALKIATKEIENILDSFTEVELYKAVLISRSHEGHEDLWIKLPDRTLVYDFASSSVLGEPVWYQLTSATAGYSRYRITDPTWCYNKWMVFDCDTGDFGYLTKETARQFDAVYRWEFGTSILYNEGRGALFNSIELACLNGRAEIGDTPQISTSYSVDGINWSQSRIISAGMHGDRLRRLVWFNQGHMKHWRVQRFRGDAKTLIAPIRVEAAIEPLSV